MRIRMLGIEVDTLTKGQLGDFVANAMHLTANAIIANHNLHSLYLFHHNPYFRRFYTKADKIHIDGMPLVFLARLLGFRVRREHRVTYLDWIWLLMEECTRRGWQVYYLGGKPGVAEKAAFKLGRKYPTLKLVTHHGYFNKADFENQDVLKEIHSVKPNILMIGMGMPRQEEWILENLERIQVNVILTAGACFDYIAGEIPIPPRWMGRIGLEWLFRLLSEPNRLWRRYLLEPWFVAWLLLNEALRRLKRVSQ